jgi:rhodanese-related sulfurtransferase
VYGAGHVPNSINIGLGGQFASWAGTLIPIGTRIAIVADSREQVDEAAMRLARVGHENVEGFILTGNYAGERRTVPQLSVNEVCDLTSGGGSFQFVDVRRVAEHNSGHAQNTLNIPLNKMGSDLEQLDPALPTYVICQGGYRSSIGTSILENAGFKDLFNVTGGTAAWMAAGLPTASSATECAATK